MKNKVSLAIEKGIATLTLDRPEQGNAIDLPMARALLEAALRCDDDAAIRCVVMRGIPASSSAAEAMSVALPRQAPRSRPS